jgi:hypothetical protein
MWITSQQEAGCVATKGNKCSGVPRFQGAGVRVNIVTQGCVRVTKLFRTVKLPGNMELGVSFLRVFGSTKTRTVWENGGHTSRYVTQVVPEKETVRIEGLEVLVFMWTWCTEVLRVDVHYSISLGVGWYVNCEKTSSKRLPPDKGTSNRNMAVAVLKWLSVDVSYTAFIVLVAHSRLSPSPVLNTWGVPVYARCIGDKYNCYI